MDAVTVKRKPIQRPARGELALYGGTPARSRWLPYGLHEVTEEDIASVVEVLRSDRLTTGPRVPAFEDAVAGAVGARYAVAFSSGTAALHAAAFAAGIGPGDEAITTPLTFCATANCVLYQGARPVFADVREDTLTLDVGRVQGALTARTKALLPVDYAGHPADLASLRELAERRGLIVIEDACHALGAEAGGLRVGSLSHMTVFSFHPVKHVTTGEGGMVTTNRADWAERLRQFRHHGIIERSVSGASSGDWPDEMTELGFNYRISDIACALGCSQLSRLASNVARRRSLAARYAASLGSLETLTLPTALPEVSPAWHLYPVRLRRDRLAVDRREVLRALWAEQIGVQVHYRPVHLHAYYRQRFGYRGGEFPVAERAYEELLTLPIFPSMTDQDVEDVIRAVQKVLGAYER